MGLDAEGDGVAVVLEDGYDETKVVGKWNRASKELRVDGSLVGSEAGGVEVPVGSCGDPQRYVAVVQRSNPTTVAVAGQRQVGALVDYPMPGTPAGVSGEGLGLIAVGIGRPAAPVEVGGGKGWV